MFRLIDWLMELPPALGTLFWDEVKRIQEDKKMPFITTPERIGMEKGMEKGLEREAPISWAKRVFPIPGSPATTANWQSPEIAAFNRAMQQEMVAPIQNKVGQLLMSPHLRNILGQDRTRRRRCRRSDLCRCVRAARAKKNPSHRNNASRLRLRFRGIREILQRLGTSRSADRTRQLGGYNSSRCSREPLARALRSRR